MQAPDDKLIRIGVFYDGNYFLHVSNYYNFSHERKARISIAGLHELIRNLVADYEQTEVNYCQVVDAHYFRGRLPAHEAKNRNKLLSERLFDDILMKEGVTTHYLPLSNTGEQNIDVWLSLETYEQVILKKYNVIVFIGCNGDFVPLVRKINATGTRVMVLGWEFEYTDEFGNKRVTVTSGNLLNEASYPVRMHQLVDDDNIIEKRLIDGLFVPKEQNYSINSLDSETPEGDRQTGRVQNIKEGYGFIETNSPGRNLFFYWEDVQSDFNEIQIGDIVEYTIGRNHRGECAIEVVRMGEGEVNYNVANTQQTYETEEDYA